jgi:hypothetical protein
MVRRAPGPRARPRPPARPARCPPRRWREIHVRSREHGGRWRRPASRGGGGRDRARPRISDEGLPRRATQHRPAEARGDPGPPASHSPSRARPMSRSPEENAIPGSTTTRSGSMPARSAMSRARRRPTPPNRLDGRALRSSARRLGGHARRPEPARRRCGARPGSPLRPRTSLMMLAPRGQARRAGSTRLVSAEMADAEFADDTANSPGQALRPLRRRRSRRRGSGAWTALPRRAHGTLPDHALAARWR